MKVLLIDVNCKNSSTGEIIYNLYSQLRADKEEAFIAYGRGPLIKEEKIYRFSPVWEVYLHALLTRVTGITGYYSAIGTNNLIRFIKKTKPDVVHIHELHAYFVNIETLINFLKKNKIKTVWTFHCEFMYTGKCGHSYNCEKWTGECGRCTQLKEYPKSEILDFTKWMFRRKKKIFEDFETLSIVTPSEWLKNRVKLSFLKKFVPRVIYNGIDTTEIFYPHDTETVRMKYGIKYEHIIFAAAPDIMRPSKGGKRILEIASRFSTNFIFIIAGIKGISEMSRADNVIKLPLITNKIELANMYSMADIFLLCSEKETFSLTTVESLCCGTPVVGFKAGAPEKIAIQKYSQFVPYGDMQELEKAIYQWIPYKNRITSAKIAQEAKMIYSKENMYKEYKKIYED